MKLNVLKRHFLFPALLLGLSASTGAAAAHEPAKPGPEAANRTFASNYKDMALATCLATAYKDAAASDAGSAAAALREWTEYDMEKSPEQVKALVDQYLRRDYGNPIAAAEGRGDIQFSLLKCLDMYHSKALNDQVKRLVYKPARTYRQEHPTRK